VLFRSDWNASGYIRNQTAGITSDNTSWNESGWKATYGNQVNLTLSQVATNVGNWSQDKGSLPNLTLSQINTNLGNYSAAQSTLARTGTCTAGTVVQNTTTSGVQCIAASASLSLSDVSANLGNWSADKPNYNTTAQLYSIFVTNASNGNWSQDKSLFASIIYVGSIGNWTLDKTSYYTSSRVDTLGNWSADKGGLSNLTYAQIVTNIGNHSADRANIAWINQTNQWASNQNFTKNITGVNFTLYDNGNCTILARGAATLNLCER
jgi:hypothetical protein